MPGDVPVFDRRSALAAIGMAGAAGVMAQSTARGAQAGGSPAGLSADEMGWDGASGRYVLPALPYAHGALEPHIDAQTMQIHHERHHAGYVAGLNRALAELAKIRSGEGDAGLVKHWSRELAFHGGGHINHAIFWATMAPPGEGGGGEPGGALGQAVRRDFGSFEAFKRHFTAAANAVEGSGWAWLVHDPVSGRLLVQQMEKQQNMLVTGVAPLLGVDVWEHAYYLRYQNRRGDYVNAFFNVINWARVGAMYEAAL